MHRRDDPQGEQAEAQREDPDPAAAARDLAPEQELGRAPQAVEVHGLEQRPDQQAEREGRRGEHEGRRHRSGGEFQIHTLDGVQGHR